MPTSKKTHTDSFQVNGEDLVKKIKELIHEGNVRRISIIDKNGKTLLILPVTIGVIGTLLAPPLAAVGALAALLTECTLKVDREE